MEKAVLNQEDLEYQKDFNVLISSFISAGNKLSGYPNLLGTKNLIYAEGLGRKILHHTLSAKHLSSGYSLNDKGSIYEPQIDFASICILTRAALETYLTFNHIYIQPANFLEHEFRFYSWDYAGYVERLKFSTRTAESM